MRWRVRALCPVHLLLFLLLSTSSLRWASADSEAESHPVRVVAGAYRRPELLLEDSEAEGSSVKKVSLARRPQEDEEEAVIGGGGKGREWRQYSMEITREDREGRKEEEEARQNDKFLKNVPKVSESDFVILLWGGKVADVSTVHASKLPHSKGPIINKF